MNNVFTQSITSAVIPSDIWGSDSPQIVESNGNILFVSTNIPKGLTEEQSLKYNILFTQIYQFEEKSNSLSEIIKIDDPKDSDEILDVVSTSNGYWLMIYHFNSKEYFNKEYRTYELIQYDNNHKKVNSERTTFHPSSLLAVRNNILVAGTKFVNNKNVNGINHKLHIDLKDHSLNNIFQKSYFPATRSSALGREFDFKLKNLSNGDIAFLSNEYHKDEYDQETFLKFNVKLSVLDSLGIIKNNIKFTNQRRVLDFIDVDNSNFFIIKATEDSSSMMNNVIANYHLTLSKYDNEGVKLTENHLVDIENIGGTTLTKVAKNKYLLSVSSGGFLRLLMIDDNGIILWKKNVFPKTNYSLKSPVDVLVKDNNVYLLGRVSIDGEIGDDFFLTKITL